VVTVDMIATGTDVKPLEIVMFMRAVRSRNFFEQMKGRGVRVINPTDLKAVTPDAVAKDRFVLIDCVGVCEQDLSDSVPLERCRTVGLDKLLQSVAAGSTDQDILSSVAGRLARLDRRLGPEERAAVTRLSGGKTVTEIAHAIVEALDADRQVEHARHMANVPPDREPTPEEVTKAGQVLLKAAAAPLASNPDLRLRLLDLKRSLEQTIDDTTKDDILDARFAPEIRERVAEKLVHSFEQFIKDHKDEITALQILYSRPYKKRLRAEDIDALAAAIRTAPRQWTPEVLWRAYETLAKDRVRGAGSNRILTDLVSLVRFALHQENELVPYAERVRERFAAWMRQQESSGRRFTDEQRQWLEEMREHFAANLDIAIADLEYVPFNRLGGVGRAVRLFGAELTKLLDELNEVLVA
jgi:type I restriction enzyme R subunit